MKSISIFFCVFYVILLRPADDAIRILILDTDVSMGNDVASFCCANDYNPSKKSEFDANLPLDKKSIPCLELLQTSLKNQKYQNGNNLFFRLSKFKTHADSMIASIRNFAHDVHIVVVPVLNSFGFCSKLQLLQALQSVHVQDFDIVLLACNIAHFDPTNQFIDAQILSLLNAFTCVVVPAGNGGYQHDKRPFFSYFFFSIGAFNAQYFISDFSAHSSDFLPSFVMPEFYDQDFGTSIAAALFAGGLAKILQIFGKKYGLKCWCKKHAKIKKQSWRKKVRYGYIDFLKLSKEK